MINSILTQMGLVPSVHDPYLYSGIVELDSNNPSTSTKAPPELILSPHEHIHVGMYADDFVFYSADPEEANRSKEELAKHIKVDFMGDVAYLLGTAFIWLCHDNDHVSAHLTHTAYTELSAHQFGVDRMNWVFNMTPYRSGIPINSIPSPGPSDPDLPRRIKVYQHIVGSIN